MPKIDHLALDDEAKLGLAEVMRNLIRHSEWATYCQALRQMRQESIEKGFADDPKELLNWQGQVQGLELAEILPSMIIHGADQILERRAKEAKLAGEPAQVIPFAKASLFEGDDSGPTF